MEAFLITARQLSILSILFLAGYIIKKKNCINDDTVKGLSFIMLSVFTPATIFMSFQIEFSQQMLKDGILITFCFAGTMFLGYAFAYIFTKMFNITGGERKVWFGSAMISNILFIGLPIVRSLYGEVGVFYLCFGMVGWNLVTYTVGIQVFKKKGEKLNFRAQMRAILLTPAIISCILGMVIFFFQLKMPSVVLDSCQYLANGTIPVSMIVSGALAAKSKLGEIFTEKNTYILSAVRLIIIPVAALFALSLFVKDEIARNTVVLSMAMPIATTVTVFAEQFADAGTIGAKYWIVTTVLSLASLPVISYIITVF